MLEGFVKSSVHDIGLQCESMGHAVKHGFQLKLMYCHFTMALAMGVCPLLLHRHEGELSDICRVSNNIFMVFCGALTSKDTKKKGV